MKNKLIAVFLLLSLLSALLLSSCVPAKQQDESSEVSQATEASPKDVFFDSLAKAFPNIRSESGLDYAETNYDAKINFDAELKSFSINSEPFIDSALGVSLQAENDADSKCIDVDCTFDYKGENPTLSFINFDGKTVCTDYFGVKLRPTLISGTISNDSLESAAEITESIDANALIEHIIASFETAVSNNVDDSLYTVETADSTVNGIEYKDATVARFTCIDGIIRRITHELLDELEKNEVLHELFETSEMDDSILESIESIRELRVKNTIVDGKSIGLDIEIAILQDSVLITNAVRLSYGDDGFTVKMGTIGANRELSTKHEIYSITYSVSGSDESLKATYYDTLNTYTEFELNGKNENGVRTGNATYRNGINYIGFSYYLELGETNGKISLYDYKLVKGNELDERYNITYTYNIDGNKTDTLLDFDIMCESDFGVIEFAGNADITEEKTDISITAPTVYASALDSEYYNRLLADQNPEFYGLIQSMTEKLMTLMIGLNSDFYISLPEDFVQTPAEGDCHSAYASSYAWIWVYKYEASSFGDFEGYKLKHFAENMRTNCAAYSPSAINQVEDIYYFYFTLEDEGYEYTYFVCAIKGDDAFWEIQIATSAYEFDELLTEFIRWSQSVTVSGRQGKIYEPPI